MAVRKESTDSNLVESISGVTEEESTVDDVFNSARKNQTRIIHVQDQIADMEIMMHETSAALASQIKKIAPSLNIFDKPALETVKEPSDTSLISKSTSSTFMQPVKVVQFGSTRRLVSSACIIPESVNDDIADLDEQSTKESIDRTIKKIPASMNVKRQRRNTLMILPKKTPWYKKMLNNMNKIYSTLYEYQLWHEHLKTVEGRFGASVVSYFLFIRWLVLMNIIILFLNFLFLVLPQFSQSQSKNSLNGSSNLLEYQSLDFNVLRGWLESTLLFIGSYSKEGIYFFGVPYSVPLAFLWVFMISFIICLVMMIRYSSFGQNEAFLIQEKTTSFANEVFSAWDFCIRTSKAAKLHRNSIVVTLKSELADVRCKRELTERSFKTWLKVYSIRVLMNILVVMWIAGCYFLIYYAAVYQLNEQKRKRLQAAGFRTLIIQYLSPLTVTSITAVSPMFFNFLISFEKYHGQTEVNISLIRNAFLSLSSVIVLVNTFHREVTCTPKGLCGAGKGADCKTPMCWETYVGQQLYKLDLSQLFVIVASFAFVNVPRAFFVKNFTNKLSKLIGLPTFFLPTEVLVAVYSQTILWLGVFYSPLLPLVTVIKLIVLFYVKKYSPFTWMHTF